jgi:hypothetical protein
MRKWASLTTLASLALIAAACGGETKTIRRETLTTVPAAPQVVERKTTVETVPPAPAVVEKQTTIRSGSVQKRTTDTIETED